MKHCVVAVVRGPRWPVLEAGERYPRIRPTIGVGPVPRIRIRTVRVRRWPVEVHDDQPPLVVHGDTGDLVVRPAVLRRERRDLDGVLQRAGDRRRGEPEFQPGAMIRPAKGAVHQARTARRPPRQPR